MTAYEKAMKEARKMKFDDMKYPLWIMPHPTKHGWTIGGKFKVECARNYAHEVDK